MPDDRRFRLTCYDAAYVRTGWIGDYDSLDVTVCAHEIGIAKIGLRQGHEKAALLWTTGARVRIEYDPGTGWQHLMSGPVRPKSATIGPDGSLSVTVEDDLRLLWRVLGWPNPAAAIGSQTSERRVITAVAETAAKTLITENAVTRLGLPVTVAATHGWGSTVTLRCRMQPLIDAILPAVEQAGVGLRAHQSGAGITVDAFQPATYPVVLTANSGVVLRGETSVTPPSATRAIIGDAGNGTARVWRRVIDTAAETEWGADHLIETLVDTSAETAGEMDAAGQEALTAAAAKAAASVELAESPKFRFGVNIGVGDIVQIDAGLPDPVVDVLRRVNLTETTGSGLVVTPQIGDRSDDPARYLIGQVQNLWLRMRQLQAH